MDLDMGRVAVRVVLTYVLLLVLLRLAGKQSIGSATAFDFMFALIVGDTLDDILWMEVNLPMGIVAAGTLVVTHIVTQLLAYRFTAVDHLVEGRPAPVIIDGRIDEAMRAREHLDDNSLDGLLRTAAGIDRSEMADGVERGQIEPNGQFTVRWRPAARPAQKVDRARLPGRPA